VYARRIFADLEVQLARDLSTPTILARVRDEFVKLLDERVRMELLVLNAATKGGTHAGPPGNRSHDDDEAAPPSRPRPSASPSPSPSASRRGGNLVAGSSASAAADQQRRSEERQLDAASSRARMLEEQLQRHEVTRAGRVTAAQQNARVARDIEQRDDDHHQRSRSNSPIDPRHRYKPSTAASSSSRRFTAHIYDAGGDDSASLSSIDSRG
jgi:hypothetical protein